MLLLSLYNNNNGPTATYSKSTCKLMLTAIILQSSKVSLCTYKKMYNAAFERYIALTSFCSICLLFTFIYDELKSHM